MPLNDTPTVKSTSEKRERFNPTLRWSLRRLGRWSVLPRFVLGIVFCLASVTPLLQARDKDKLAYGEGLIVNVPFPEAEVEQAVQDVAQNGIIRGTKEYNKDEYVAGAKEVDATKVFPKWTEGGKVFYKVRLQALDPRNFKDSGDLGTLAVRYVLQPQGEKNTVLRINAVFVEDFRKTVHASNGSVEGSEYKDVRDHLDAAELIKQQTVESEQERQLLLKKKAQGGGGEPVGMSTSAPATTVATAPPPSRDAAPVSASPAPATMASNGGTGRDAGTASQALRVQLAGQIGTSQDVPSPAPSGQATQGQAAPDQAISAQTLEQHVQDLRRQVERLVKSPGAPLKSAPFHTASTLSPLTTGTEVLILISTPYWYGVETRDGQHGWIFRDSVETLP